MVKVEKERNFHFWRNRIQKLIFCILKNKLTPNELLAKFLNTARCVIFVINCSVYFKDVIKRIQKLIEFSARNICRYYHNIYSKWKKNLLKLWCFFSPVSMKYLWYLPSELSSVNKIIGFQFQGALSPGSTCSLS